MGIVNKEDLPRRRRHAYHYFIGVRVEKEIGDQLKILKETHFIDTPGLIRSAIRNVVCETIEKLEGKNT